MEAISTVPPDRSLTSLDVCVTSPVGMRGLLSLAANTVIHALERIRVTCNDYGFQLSEADTEISVFRLLTIPTLRVFSFKLLDWSSLTPGHLNVIRDCIRARARSGAPPLHALVFDNRPSARGRPFGSEFDPVIFDRDPARFLRSPMGPGSFESGGKLIESCEKMSSNGPLGAEICRFEIVMSLHTNCMGPIHFVWSSRAGGFSTKMYRP